MGRRFPGDENFGEIGRKRMTMILAYDLASAVSKLVWLSSFPISIIWNWLRYLAIGFVAR